MRACIVLDGSRGGRGNDDDDDDDVVWCVACMRHVCHPYMLSPFSLPLLPLLTSYHSCSTVLMAASRKTSSL